MTIQIVGSVFKGLGVPGDFSWMVNQPEYNDCLFIFNDNIECHGQPIPGGGNAVMRVYINTLPKPRSFGIPTGSLALGGFTRLDSETKSIIDKAFEDLKSLLKTHEHKYKTIYFSQKSDTEKILGTSIFKVDPKVVKYITKRLKKLA